MHVLYIVHMPEFHTGIYTGGRTTFLHYNYGTGCVLSMLPLGGGGPTVSQHVCLLRIKLISPYMYAVLCVKAIIICFQLSGGGGGGREKNRVPPPPYV